MELADALVLRLREPEDRGLKISSDRLVRLHQEATNTDVMGCMYNGQVFRHSNAPSGRIAYPSLDRSLYAEAEAHLARLKRLTTDIQMIRQALLSLVQTCINRQDLRDVLPECLVHLASDELARMPRTRAPAWNLDPNGRPYRSYLKILPKIEFFAAARLMY